MIDTCKRIEYGLLVATRIANEKRRTAAEIIAFHFCSLLLTSAHFCSLLLTSAHFCSDMRDVSDGRYQSTRFANPAIYSIGNDYFAAPSNNKPPKNMPGDWKEIGEHHGRKVFQLKTVD